MKYKLKTTVKSKKMAIRKAKSYKKFKFKTKISKIKKGYSIKAYE